MNQIPIQTLGKVATGIALVGSVGLYGVRWGIQGRLRESNSYKEALQCFRSNANAVDLLGEPIHEKRIDIGDNNCYGRNDDMGWAIVPLQGKKHNGNLIFWVKFTNPEKNEFHLSKVELEIEKTNTRIVLRDAPPESKLDEFAAE